MLGCMRSCACVRYLLAKPPAGLGWCLAGVVWTAYTLYVGCLPWELILVIVASSMDAGGDVTVEGPHWFVMACRLGPLADAASQDPSSAACSCVEVGSDGYQ
jgi:hypothetical protein